MESWQKDWLESREGCREREMRAVPDDLRDDCRFLESAFPGLPIETTLEALHANSNDVWKANRWLKNLAFAAEAKSKIGDDTVNDGSVNKDERPLKRKRGADTIKRENSDEEDKGPIRQFPVTEFIPPTDDEIKKATMDEKDQMLKTALSHIRYLEQTSGKIAQQPFHDSSPERELLSSSI